MSRESDAAELAKLGYAQQLLRDMGGFQSFALSFSIISILTGAVTLYGTGLRAGGPLEMSLGWLVVSIMTLPIAASLAQLASSYPTAGALYHWSAILGGRGHGFATAWLNTVGQVAVTAGVDYGLAGFLAPMLGWPGDRAHVLPIYAALLASHAILNHLGVRAVAMLNWVSAWYHLIAVALIVGVLLALAPLRPVSFLTTTYTQDGHGILYGFAIGLLQAQWTMTGYDASAHVTEETMDPRRNAPWGVFLSVAVSGVVGWIMLLAVTLAIQDLPAAAGGDDTLSFAVILTTALGERLGNALVWAAMAAMWFCGLASITSSSRMLFAFARDGGVPGGAALAKVSPRWRSPHVAVWASAVAAFLVAIWARAYSAMIALSTIALYASYAAPIAIGLVARRSGRWQTRGPWDLGRWSTAVNLVALAWIAIVTVLFVLPPNQLAGTTFAGVIALLAATWFGWMRTRFAGPRVIS